MTSLSESNVSQERAEDLGLTEEQSAIIAKAANTALEEAEVKYKPDSDITYQDLKKVGELAAEHMLRMMQAPKDLT